MTSRTNEFGQPIGSAVLSFHAPSIAELGSDMRGRLCLLEPLHSKHAADLFEAFSKDDGRMWTYLQYGPFKNLEDFEKNYIDRFKDKNDPKMFAVIERASGKAVGCTGFLRTFLETGSVEIGHIAFSPQLQRTTHATEALYLMIRNSFDLGLRRCEWKCDSLNMPSSSAARRLGFKHEGIFRQSVVYKGRNRDTEWLSIIDSEWPAIHANFKQWLSPDNFDAKGLQKTKLSESAPVSLLL